MADVNVEQVERLRKADLDDLCDAADQAILEGGGFGWVEPPPRELMERFWKGVLVVPERSLFIGRVDGVVAGSAQLVRPPRNNEAQAHSASLTTSFVAPWARGHGLARMLTLAVEDAAKKVGVRILNLDLRNTQEAAIYLYRSLGYVQFGYHPVYAFVRGQPIAGLYFYKDLNSVTV